MSLKSLDLGGIANTACVMTLLHLIDRTPLQNGDVPVTISLLGKDSDVFVKATRVIRNKAMERAKAKIKYAAAEQDQEALETIARCTTGWTGIPLCWIDGSDDESNAEFSFENAVKLYERQRWIFEQADEFVGGRENLLKAASKI